jgi:hypothetical protein
MIGFQQQGPILDCKQTHKGCILTDRLDVMVA